MPIAKPDISDIARDLSSGHGTAESIGTLVEGMVAMRLILLRQLTSAVDDETSERSGLHAAYQTLAALQSEHPDIVAAMLTYPNTGPWLSQVLRRVTCSSNDSDVPLWAECAYLGWLAAAAAITCRTEGTAQVIIRNGVVMLPTVGMARLGPAGYHGPCEVTWNDSRALHFTWPEGATHIDSRTAETQANWLPMRSMRVAPGEPQVWLDDLDPYRALQPSQPDPPRLTPDQAEQWQHTFADAWQLLGGELGEYLPAMRACLTSVAPLSSKPLPHSTSHTAWTGVGCVYTTAPADSCQLALTLIHEIQHTKLSMLTDQLELLIPDPANQYYAPWRDDPRPMFGLLHGIYAFYGVTDFWRAHRNSACHGSAQAHADFELWRMQVIGAIGQAQGSGLLTDAGQRFMAALAETMCAWQSEELPPAARRAATEASIAHRTFWRVRNLEPDRDGIAELAARWATHRPRSRDLPEATLTDQQRVPEHHRQLPFAAQLRMVDPRAVSVLGSGQSEGDRAYLAGYPTEALALYTRELRTDPLRPQTWAGLNLAGQRIFGSIPFDPLSEHGEVVAHLYQLVGPDVDIVSLLRWLAAPSD